MIQLLADADLLLLRYIPEGDPSWVADKLESGESIVVRRTFHFGTGDLLAEATEDDSASDVSDEYMFRLGELSGEYYRINPDVVATTNTFHFHQGMSFSPKLFVADRNISILRRIDKLVSEDVYIGGAREDAMPQSAYLELLDKFPNSYEMTLYASARVGGCLRDYFESATDVERGYQKYLNKRISPRSSGIIAAFRENEIAKYQALLEKLQDMLADEASYSEKQWQAEILDIIRLLYPKYIHAFTEAPVWDSISKKERKVDFLLVDSCGNVDIIEIKRPFDNCIVSKRQYRDNYIPLKELSGTIMQLEKYILYLNKWGQQGEDRLSRRYKDALPAGLQLRIINPKGIVVIGRGHTLSSAQRDDFEVIKRKYSNVIDIVTYDDLLARLAFTIDQLRAGESKQQSKEGTRRPSPEKAETGSPG